MKRQISGNTYLQTVSAFEKLYDKIALYYRKNPKVFIVHFDRGCDVLHNYVLHKGVKN